MKNDASTHSVFSKGGAGLIATLLAVVLALCALPVLGASQANAYDPAKETEFYCNPGSYTYTGEAIVPSSTYVTTSNGANVLLEGKDYTVTYENNTNVGAATATVIIGNQYQYVKTNAFTITALDLSEAIVYVDDQVYTGKDLTPAVTVMLNGKVVPASAYKVYYYHNKDVGTATASIVANDANYDNGATGTFEIVNAKFAVADIADAAYTGGDIAPELTVTNAEESTTTLDKGTDYAVSYKNNVNVGLAAVEVTGLGSYAGASMTKYFAITADKFDADFSVADIADCTYTGQAITPAIVVKQTLADSSVKTLQLGKDYVVSYENNVNAGTATVTVTGIGNYSGTLTQTFTIEKADIASCTVYPIASQVYTGSPIAPALTVTGLAGEAVELGNGDVTYSDNKEVGTATATIESVSNSNYTVGAAKTVQFQIVPADGFTVAAIANQSYTGSAIEPTVAVTKGTTPLTKGTDYTVQYFDNTDAGVAKVVVTGIGGYAGSSFTTYFNITAKSMGSVDVAYISNQTYTGAAIEPAVVVKDGSTVLQLGTDYTVAYANNTNLGQGYAFVTGIGNYAGTKDSAFTIVEADLSKCTVDAIDDVVFTGSQPSPKITVRNESGAVLVEGTDYTVATYGDYSKVGTAKMELNGKGNYKNSLAATYKIVEAPFTVDAIDDSACKYTGSAVEPAVTVRDASGAIIGEANYDVAYDNNVEAGLAVATVTGKGNYEGTLSRYFTIQAATGLTIGTIASQTYTGSAIEPAVSVTNADSKDLVLGKDYVVSYKDNVAAGTNIATATVTGIGNYAGTASANFTIAAASIADCTIFPIADQIYMGGASIEPALTIQGLNGTSLKKGTDYGLLYSFNKNVGTATVTVTGKGNYAGSTTTASFNIVASKFNVTAADATYNYGAAVETALTFTDVTGAALTLTAGTDYTVQYWDNTNAGVATVQVTGTGNYAGSQVTTFFTIAPVALTDANVAKVYSQTYTGSAIEPALTVTAGGKTLEQGTDYTVSYTNNTNVTANKNYACAYVAGTGNYTGTAKTAFEITKASLKDCTAVVVGDNVYTGSAIVPSVVVTNAAGNVLAQGTDYTVACSDVNAGTATATITAAGSNYADSTTVNFTVLTASFTVDEIADVEYTGALANPTVVVRNAAGTELAATTDYTVAVQGTDAETWGIATITGAGNYAGTTVQKRFWITKADLSDCTVNEVVTGNYLADQRYAGAQITPAISMKGIYGEALVAGDDYTVEYGANYAYGTQGTVTMTAAAGSNYKGTKTVVFDIVASVFEVADITGTFTYTAEAIEPELAVTDKYNSRALVEGVDYEAVYSENEDASESNAKVTVTGLGAYAAQAGSNAIQKTFKIAAANASGCTVLPIADQVYKGKDITPAVEVLGVAGEKLVQGTDFDVKFGSNVKVGTVDVTITFKKNYEGTQTTTFNIVESKLAVGSIAAQTYSGEAKTPTLTVTDAKSGSTLAADDYTVQFWNNTDAGVATVVVTGANNYAGSQVTAYFVIGPKTITEDMVAVEASTYTGKALTPAVTVTDGDVELRSGIDYTVSYADDKAVVKGAGNYTGKVEKAFAIGKADLSLCTVEFAIDQTYTYTGSAITPVVVVRDADGTIVDASNYGCAYVDYVNAGTATVTVEALASSSYYTGSIAKQYVINPAEFTVAPIEDQQYTGADVEPTVSVKRLDGIAGEVTYTAEYANNVKAGSEAVVTVTGTGNYAGCVKQQTFWISNGDLSVADVTLEKNAYNYTGSQITPVVTSVKIGSAVLTEGTDYTVAYGDNTDVFSGTVTILPALNSSFAGSKTVTFAINKTPFTDQYIQVADIASQEYTGSAITPALTVVDKATGKVLEQGIDYDAVYTQNVNVGNASVVTLTGKGGYTGNSLTSTFSITKAPLSSCTFVPVADQVYTGEQIKPEVVCYALDGKQLNPATKLVITYGENKEVGTGTIHVESNARNYEGSVDLSFNIVESAFAVTAADQEYNGTNAPELTVLDKNTDKTLAETDYSVQVWGNDKAGVATVTVTGKSDAYKGSQITTYYNIAPKSITGATVQVEAQNYTGSPLTPAVEVKVGDVTLAADDYVVSYSNNVNPGTGTAQVVVTGTGNYTDTATGTFTIASPSLAGCVVGPIEDQAYTGSEIIPAVEVSFNGKALKADTDYVVEKGTIDNVNCGDAEVVVKPAAGSVFTGEQTVGFQIVPSSNFVLHPISSAIYTGSAITPDISVTSGSSTLDEGKDYTKEIVDNTNAGEATVTVIGTGNYTGTQTQTFQIVKRDMGKCDVVTSGDMTYTGSAVEPAVAVKYDGKTIDARQYSVSYSNNVNVGTAYVTVTATADSNFRWSKTVEFAITPSTFGADQITIPATENLTYTGAAVQPKPVVTDAKSGAVLVEGVDYTLSYDANIDAGNNSKLYVTGIGNYASVGTVEKDFQIQKLSFEKCSIDKIGDKVYTGAEIALTKDELVVRNVAGNVIDPANYDVTYSANRTDPGTVTVTVTARKDIMNYQTGTQASATFQIVASEFVVSAIAPQAYTGSAVEPELEVVDANTAEKLYLGDDYTVQFTGNINAGSEARAIVTGVNGYVGSEVTAYFTITQRSLAAEGISVEQIAAQAYTGSQVEPAIVVKDGEKELVPTQDYTVQFANNIQPGTATARIIGKGNYTGSIENVNFEISAGVFDATYVDAIADQTYTGAQIMPEVTVRNAAREVLVKGLDYTVSYRENVSVGEESGIAIIKGIGAYEGSRAVAKFDIVASDGFEVANLKDKVYTGKAITPKPQVTFNGQVLTEGVDFTYAWNNNTNAGLSAYVAVTGMGNFTGTQTKNFKIAKADIADCNVEVANQVYTGSAIEPAVTVTFNGITVDPSQYTVAYSSNVNVGTASVILTATPDSNFTGIKSDATFQITTSTFNGTSIEPVEGQTYSGLPIEPKPVVHEKTIDGRVLTEGVDYTLAYDNNVNKGNLSHIKVTGINGFAGQDSDVYFTIGQLDLANCTIDAIADKIYTGNEIVIDGEEIVVRTPAGVEINASNYIVSYEKNIEVGTATLIVTAKDQENGNYVANSQVSTTFNIVESDFTVMAIDDQIYTGSAITLDETKLVVTDKGNAQKVLVEGTDFTTEYWDNLYVGSASLKITGKGNYAGSELLVHFRIAPKSLGTAEQTASGITVSVDSPQAYTGAALTPEVAVKDGDIVLAPGIDYVVSYANNIQTGENATVTVRGAGNYTGLAVQNFVIGKASLAGGSIDQIANQVYTGSDIEPAVVVRDASNRILSEGADYELSFSDNVNAGLAAVTVTPAEGSNFDGELKATFTIEPSTSISVADIWNSVYTGDSVEPDVVVTDPRLADEQAVLVKDKDYTLTFANNIAASSNATATVTGIGNYSGTVEKSFQILKADLADCDVSIENQVFDGEAQTPDVTVTYNGRVVDSSQYKVAYGNNVNVGTADVLLTATPDSNFKWEKTATFGIGWSGMKVDKDAVEARTDIIYIGEDEDGKVVPIEPKIEVRDLYTDAVLVEGTDYVIEYRFNDSATHGTNVAIAKVVGIGNYLGCDAVDNIYFHIQQLDLSDCTILPIEDQVYDGNAKTPAVTILNNAGTAIDPLDEDNNFRVTYEKNIDAGTATVTVEVINENLGNYKGSTSVTFNIVESEFVVEPIADQIYTGSPITLGADALVVKDKGNAQKILVEGTDFTTEYWDNVYVGSAYLKITGIGNYAGSELTTHFRIVKKGIAGEGAIEIQGVEETYEYTGFAIEPNFLVVDAVSGEELVEGESYTVKYSNNVNVTEEGGEPATITVTGIGNYSGKKYATFKIVKTDTDAFRVINVEDQTFTGSQITPALTVIRTPDGVLQAGTDYTVEYGENIHVGTGTATVIGMGSYRDMKTTVTFNIVPLDATHIARVTVDPDTNKYTGEPIEPDVYITVNGLDLVRDTDFTVAYSDNIEVSSREPNAANLPTVTIAFKGDYEGTAYATFEITVADCIELSGIDRYETATLIAKEAYPNGSSVAILTTGLNFPDALAAASYAGMRDCPILLTDPSELTPVTADALQEMGVQDVVIVGGTSAVSERVKYSVRALGIDTMRIEGADRYATADALYSSCMALGNMNDVAVVATGTNFADALSVSGYAFMTNSPIFLVNEAGELTYTAKKAIADGAFNKVIVLGGEAVVPSTVDEYIESNNTEVIRLAGADRYATNLKISQFCLSNGMTADGALIATGMNFPDALAGGVLAGKTQSIMILADDQSSQALGALTHGSDIRSITFLGGTNAVSKYVRNAAMRAAGLL